MKLSEELQQTMQEMKDYLHTNMEYYRLEIFKKTSKTVISLLFAMVAMMLVFTAFVFVSIALGSYLAQWLGSFPLAYLVLGLFYLILLVVWGVFGKSWLESTILKTLSKIFFETRSQK